MFSLQVVFTADAGFLENMKMSSSLPKILETGIHVFKGNSQTIKKLKNLMINVNFIGMRRKIIDD